MDLVLRMVGEPAQDHLMRADETCGNLKLDLLENPINVNLFHRNVTCSWTYIVPSGNLTVRY